MQKKEINSAFNPLELFFFAHVYERRLIWFPVESQMRKQIKLCIKTRWVDGANRYSPHSASAATEQVFPLRCSLRLMILRL